MIRARLGSGAGSYRRGVTPQMARCSHSHALTRKKKIGNHARLRWASATALLRTGVDMCRAGAGSSAGSDTEPTRRRSNTEWRDDQAGRRGLANTHADGGSRVHSADDTPSRKAATRARHCNFMRQGGGRPSAVAGSRRNGTMQAVAATSGERSEGNAASSTALA